MEEVRAIADAASCQATYDFDPFRGVPFDLFARQRILASVQTRYRQEWVYALHRAPDDNADYCESLAENSLVPTSVHHSLHEALSCLPQKHYRLLEQLFWEGRTEAELGAALGISQRGVSKRKQAALADLRLQLERLKNI